MNMKVTLNNGVEMPALGLGVFQTPPQETTAAVAAALTTGYCSPTARCAPSVSATSCPSTSTA